MRLTRRNKWVEYFSGVNTTLKHILHRKISHKYLSFEIVVKMNSSFINLAQN